MVCKLPSLGLLRVEEVLYVELVQQMLDLHIEILVLVYSILFVTRDLQTTHSVRYIPVEVLTKSLWNQCQRCSIQQNVIHSACLMKFKSEF